MAMWPRRDPNRQNAIARKKETLRGKWNKTHWLRMSIAVTRGNKTQNEVRASESRVVEKYVVEYSGVPRREPPRVTTLRVLI